MDLQDIRVLLSQNARRKQCQYRRYIHQNIRFSVNYIDIGHLRLILSTSSDVLNYCLFTGKCVDTFLPMIIYKTNEEVFIMKKYPENTLDFLKHVDGKVYDVCAIFYLKYLKTAATAEIAAQRLREFYENCGYTESDQMIHVEAATAPETFSQLIDENRDIVAKIVENLIEQNPSVENFYQLLWKQMQNKILFPSDDAVVAIIIQLFFMENIPYYQLCTVDTMEDDEYVTLLESVKKMYQKAIFAINRGYLQKTQVAGQLLMILKEMPSMEEQEVFVAQLIGYYKSKNEYLKNKVDDLEKQLEEANGEEEKQVEKTKN